MVHNSSTQNFKITVIKPILDRWNETIHEDWLVEAGKYDKEQVVIRSLSGRENIHGLLITDIAEVCHAFDWCWDLRSHRIGREGIEIHIL